MGVPTISVIIPTAKRPALVLRAVRSALNQTYRDLEVIVVVDGHDPETVDGLRKIDDGRLRIVQNTESLGAGEARNAGVAAALGGWVAFIDDDDEWLPSKLEHQLGAVSSEDIDVIVTCRCRVVTPLATYIWPRRIYDGETPLDEYLFDRRSLFRGESFIATPTMWLMPRRLFQLIKFRNMRRHEDWDFLLRATKQFGVRIKSLPEVLAVIYTEEARQSLGNDVSWRDSLAWIDQIRPLITPRAYSGFCLTILSTHVARIHEYSAIPLLMRRARTGSPTAIQKLLFVSFWLLPVTFRQRLRAWCTADGLGSRAARDFTNS